MTTAIIVITIIINLFAIVLNVKMLTGVELTKKLIIVALSEFILFLVVSLVYAISMSGAEPSVSMNFVKFALLGVNMMAIGAPIARICARKDNGDITDDELRSKIIKIGIISAFILVIEGVYISSILR